MSETIKVRLWETGQASKLARQFSKLPPDRKPTVADMVWIPLSQIEHTSRLAEVPGQNNPLRLRECLVTVPLWLAEEKGLT